jgi:hypothetical protein
MKVLFFGMNFVISSALVMCFAAPAYAEASLAERVIEDRQSVNCSKDRDCQTAGVAVAGSGVSTALAVKKYKHAKNLEALHAKTLLEASGGMQPYSMRSVSLMNSVQDGDKVVVHYQLSIELPGKSPVSYFKI